MKDALGNDVAVGDTVVYIHTGYGTAGRLKKSTVVRLTAKRIFVAGREYIGNDGIKRTFEIICDPIRVVKYPEG